MRPPAGGGSPSLESGLSLVVPQSSGQSQEQPVLGQRLLQTPHLSEMIEALCWPCPCHTLIHTYYACPQPSTMPWTLTPAQPGRPAFCYSLEPKTN